MNVRLHHLEDAAEQLEITTFLRLKWMLDKEWDDRPLEIFAPAHAESSSVAMITSDDSAIEEFPQRMQQLDVALVLHDGELWQHLAVRSHAVMNRDPDMKTAFTVHEACDPFRLEF